MHCMSRSVQVLFFVRQRIRNSQCLWSNVYAHITKRASSYHYRCSVLSVVERIHATCSGAKRILKCSLALVAAADCMLSIFDEQHKWACDRAAGAVHNIPHKGKFAACAKGFKGEVRGSQLPCIINTRLAWSSLPENHMDNMKFNSFPRSSCCSAMSMLLPKAALATELSRTSSMTRKSALSLLARAAATDS